MKLNRTSFIYFTDEGEPEYWRFLEQTFANTPFNVRFGGYLAHLPRGFSQEDFISSVEGQLKERGHQLDWNVLREYGTMDMKDVMEKAKSAYANPNAISTAVPWYFQRFFSAGFDDNVVLVLRNHITVSPKIVDERGTVQLHYIGRGFSAFGASANIQNTPHFGCDIYPYYVKTHGREVERRFLLDLAKHEVIGHQNCDLSDHYSEEGSKEGCLMVPARGVDQLVRRLISEDVNPFDIRLC